MILHMKKLAQTGAFVYHYDAQKVKKFIQKRSKIESIIAEAITKLSKAFPAILNNLSG